MASVRYYAALVFIMLMPGALLYWLSIHPFIRFWRRAGARVTLRLHLAAIALLAFAVYLRRGPLLAREYGDSALLAALGIALYAAGMVYGVRVRRQLKTRILIGVPELDPEGRGIPVMTGGAYARVRHPRYLQIILAAAGWALFSNYLAGYVAFALTLILILIIIPIEERELLARFGRDYADYRARTPRLIPRFRRNI